MPAARLLAVVALASLATPASAQQFFEFARDFLIEKPCEAYSSLRRSTSPSPLEVGKVYAGRGVNKQHGATHAFIRVSEKSSKWVALTCGRFTDGAEPYPAPANITKPDRGVRSSEDACLPFFDTVDEKVNVKVGGLVDISPPPPQLDAFDEAINAACGRPGTVVSPDQFKALFAANPDVLERLKAFTGGKVFATRPPHVSAASYLEDLTEAWFAIKAFDHIMCGEPGAGSGKIGGLHFAGRYLRLQTTGEACLMGNYRQNEVVPGVIYTTGVIMRMGDGREVRDAIKGYGLTLSGEDIMKAVTRAFAENPTTSDDSVGCLLPVKDDGKEFTAVFVRRAAGIRTFYPDATPNGRGDKKNDPCAATISLQ